MHRKFQKWGNEKIFCKSIANPLFLLSFAVGKTIRPDPPELRQVRKEATVASSSGCRIAGLSPNGIDGCELRSGDRAVEGARLESVCAERYRGFESLPLRQLCV